MTSFWKKIKENNQWFFTQSWLGLPRVDQVTGQLVFLIISQQVNSPQISFETWPILSLGSRVNPLFFLIDLSCLHDDPSREFWWPYMDLLVLCFFRLLLTDVFPWFHPYMFGFLGIENRNFFLIFYVVSSHDSARVLFFFKFKICLDL